MTRSHAQAGAETAAKPGAEGHGKPGSLALRRQRLLGDIKRQRQVFSMQAAALDAPIRSLNRGVTRVRHLKQHPAPLLGIAAGAALAVVVIKPRRLKAMARGVQRAARLVSMAMPLIARLAQRSAQRSAHEARQGPTQAPTPEQESSPEPSAAASPLQPGVG